MLYEIWKWVGGALLLVGCVWLLWKVVFADRHFVWDYEQAQWRDLEAYQPGMTLEEAHKERDKVLKRAGMY